MRNPADKITAIKTAIDEIVAETWTTSTVVLNEWNLAAINPELPYGIINAGVVEKTDQPAVNLQTAKIKIDFAFVTSESTTWQMCLRNLVYNRTTSFLLTEL